MATIEENLRHWESFYAWDQSGDEWSEAWGGSEALWRATLRPRLEAMLPAGDVLEIAPGHGRITRFLAPLSRRLVLVDLAPNCIAACESRFVGLRHLEYHVNDGRSLPMVASSSIDAVVSFDSLVHAGHDAIAGYLPEIARVLRPGGTAFLHHSNLDDLRRETGGEVENPHWRAADIGASAVRELATQAGMDCVAQERVAWGGLWLNDCFTWLVNRPPSAPTEILDRPDFMAEAASARFFAGLGRALDLPRREEAGSPRPSRTSRLRAWMLRRRRPR
jgi:SAM-dependent methyltransferase